MTIPTSLRIGGRAVAATAGTGLDLVRAAAAAQRRVIVDVFLDERRLDEEAIHRLVVGSAREDLVGEELRFVTADPHDLAGETFEHAADVLDQLATLHGDAAAQLQAGRIPDALKSLQDALGLWGDARQGVAQATALIGLDVESLAFTDPAAVGALQSLAASLAEIKSTVARQDWTALADALAYEMDPVVIGWRALLRELSDRVKSERARKEAAER